MGSIFISYSRQDKEYVDKLQDALRENGLNPWVDDRKDDEGDWPKANAKQMEKSDAFIFVMSDHSEASLWVQDEYLEAIWENKPTFALLLQGKDWIERAEYVTIDVRDGKLPPQSFFEELNGL
jgi:hypothetical protein